MTPSGGVQFAFAKVQPTNKTGVKGCKDPTPESSGEAQMQKPREVLLIAALAGLLIVGVAAFVVQPSLVGTLSMGAMQPASHAVLNGADLPLGPTA
jgi:hypothetical protein